MKLLLRVGTAAVLLGVALTVNAEESATPTYRSPADMTVEERTAIMGLVGEYNSCVYKEGMARVKDFHDIRQAADAAMGACDKAINALHEKIESFHFEPAFGDHFTHHAQARAARTLLPELAIKKSEN
ncbi:MAG: hypothetical protein HYX63_09875 [Gammaproteobacteria bacterium]|nr:hypothetical protein [Gammaproteobacteria bacterium]